MGLGVNICVSLIVLAAFAGWTLSRLTVPRFVRWINLIERVGILTLLFCIVAPNDRFQQESIRATTPSVRVSAQARVERRRSSEILLINSFVKAKDPIRVCKTSRSFVRDQLLSSIRTSTLPIPIHSPPVAS
jgi:hypothetical protein